HRTLAPVAVIVGLVAVTIVGHAAAQPMSSMSERGIVTRVEHGLVPAPNPLRHVPDEILVKLRPGLPPAVAAQALAGVPARFTRRFHAVEHLYHLQLAAGVSLHHALRQLRPHPHVLYAQPNFLIQA